MQSQLFQRSIPLFALLVVAANAFKSFQSQIPNGANVKFDGKSWPGVGHTKAAGGGARNAFGKDFAAAGKTWTVALCNKDSDGDGASNGKELGDPECVWKVGDQPASTEGITFPGKPEGSSKSSGRSVSIRLQTTVVAGMFVVAMLL